MIIRMRSLTGALVYGGVARGLLWAILPTVVLFLLSFTAGPVSSFPPQELTLSSYRELLGSEELRRVLLNSLTVSVIATGVALIVGVPAGLALYRHRVPFARSLNVFFGLSFVVPVVVSGLGFLILFQRIGIVGNLPSIGVAVAIINLPFMLWAVAAAVGGMNPELDQAAATLGAEGVERFLFVTLPGIAPGILVGVSVGLRIRGHRLPAELAPRDCEYHDTPSLHLRWASFGDLTETGGGVGAVRSDCYHLFRAGDEKAPSGEIPGTEAAITDRTIGRLGPPCELSSLDDRRS